MSTESDILDLISSYLYVYFSENGNVLIKRRTNWKWIKQMPAGIWISSCFLRNTCASVVLIVLLLIPKNYPNEIMLIFVLSLEVS